nr:uncharacterized protein LOC118966982 [Manis javanica]
MLCISSCCRKGFPLAGLMPGLQLLVCGPGGDLQGRRHSRLCIAVGDLGASWPARRMERLKILKVPNLLGRVHLDNFVYLSFLLSIKLCSILAPFAAFSLEGSLPAYPPREAGYGSLFFISSWTLSLSREPISENAGLNPCYSKCGPETSVTSVPGATWKLVGLSGPSPELWRQNLQCHRICNDFYAIFQTDLKKWIQGEQF